MAHETEIAYDTTADFLVLHGRPLDRLPCQTLPAGRCELFHGLPTQPQAQCNNRGITEDSVVSDLVCTPAR